MTVFGLHPRLGLPLLLGQTELGWLETWLVRLFDQAVGPLGAALAVVAAVGIGAAHALAPGHGKGIVAAYLVGERGRPRDAAALGIVVALMHTASVLVVALLLVAAARAAPGPDTLASIGSLSPRLTLAAGLLVTLVGLILVTRQVRRRRAGRRLAATTTSARGHDHHHHPAPAKGVSPLSRSGLVLLGMSGGLLPSPSAFLVLTTGLFTGRAAFALLLVAAFSVGLAVTLTAIGLAVLWGKEQALERLTPGSRLSWLSRGIPLASAVLVLVIGVGATALALLRL